MTIVADYAWSGIMGFSRDAAPWVGQIPGMSGLFICAGYTGHGMPNATLCAKAVVDLLLESDRDGDVVVRAGSTEKIKMWWSFRELDEQKVKVGLDR